MRLPVTFLDEMQDFKDMSVSKGPLRAVTSDPPREALSLLRQDGDSIRKTRSLLNTDMHTSHLELQGNAEPDSVALGRAQA